MEGSNQSLTGLRVKVIFILPSMVTSSMLSISLKTQNQMFVAVCYLLENCIFVCLHLQRAVILSHSFLSTTTSKCFFSKSTHKDITGLNVNIKCCIRKKNQVCAQWYSKSIIALVSLPFTHSLSNSHGKQCKKRLNSELSSFPTVLLWLKSNEPVIVMGPEMF